MENCAGYYPGPMTPPAIAGDPLWSSVGIVASCWRALRLTDWALSLAFLPFWLIKMFQTIPDHSKETFYLDSNCSSSSGGSILLFLFSHRKFLLIIFSSGKTPPKVEIADWRLENQDASDLCHVGNTNSHTNTEVRQHWARIVLGWETAR